MDLDFLFVAGAGGSSSALLKSAQAVAMYSEKQKLNLVPNKRRESNLRI